jgi:hypothetical protein
MKKLWLMLLILTSCAIKEGAKVEKVEKESIPKGIVYHKEWEVQGYVLYIETSEHLHRLIVSEAVWYRYKPGDTIK